MTTGAATLIGSTGATFASGNFVGLADLPLPAPEPSPALLIGLAVVRIARATRS